MYKAALITRARACASVGTSPLAKNSMRSWSKVMSYLPSHRIRARHARQCHGPTLVPLTTHVRCHVPPHTPHLANVPVGSSRLHFRQVSIPSPPSRRWTTSGSIYAPSWSPPAVPVPTPGPCKTPGVGRGSSPLTCISCRSCRLTSRRRWFATLASQSAQTLSVLGTHWYTTLRPHPEQVSLVYLTRMTNSLFPGRFFPNINPRTRLLSPRTTNVPRWGTHSAALTNISALAMA